MTGPGQRELVGHALAEAAAGRVWTATAGGRHLGEGRFAMRCEPLAGLGGGAGDRPAGVPAARPGWLSEAAARIGSTLDLTRTGKRGRRLRRSRLRRRSRHLRGGAPARGGRALLAPGRARAVVRRLAARLAGQDEAVTDGLLRARRGAGLRRGLAPGAGDGDRRPGPVRPAGRGERGTARPPPRRPGSRLQLQLVPGHAAHRPRDRGGMRDLLPDAGQPRVQHQRHRAGR